MTYSQTVNWMFEQLPMYQREGKKAYKEDLHNTRQLAAYLGNPENKFQSIHVGGTNGKGSTSHILASILQEAGYNVGLYTSPHLKDFRERIRINGNEISKQFVIGFIKKHQSYFKNERLSFFEMTVGMAFDYFARKAVDIAIIEVGLGGRLDSTNIITPLVSVITNIGFDHQDFLGDTLAKIAAEKAGIMKSNIPVVIGERHPDTTGVFIDNAKAVDAPIAFAQDFQVKRYETDLKGAYQPLNIQTALVGLSKLPERFQIREEHITKGLLNVVSNTKLLGRWQVLHDAPLVVCDTAHNEEGLSLVMQQIKTQNYNQLHCVLGFVNDKDLDKLAPLFPKTASFYFCKPKVSRGKPANEVAKIFSAHQRKGSVFSSVEEAYKSAFESAKSDDMIYVGGSTFVVAEVI